MITVTATNNSGADLASGAALLNFTIATTQDAVVEGTENFTVTLAQRDGDGGHPTDHDDHNDNDTSAIRLMVRGRLRKATRPATTR